MTDRTAIDTIRGYFYQFDYAIASLLELQSNSGIIDIEGIEDIDIRTANEETAIQCKYYAKTEYNHSVIAKPIRLMLNHYKEVKDGTKQKIKYKLYGYYKTGQDKLELPLTLSYLKENFLIYTKESIIHSHHTKLKLNDRDLKDFISLLTIDIHALEYKSQLAKIIKLLMKNFDCNLFEAENFYYNNALKTIKDIAVKADIADRKISKAAFISRINLKAVLFNEWFNTYKGQHKLYSDIKKEYFTVLNISPAERFFLIETPNEYTMAELKEVIFIISKKWSKLSKREPQPFCPYLYLNNISEDKLIELKSELFNEDFIFEDGFDYNGASFNPRSLSKKLNKTNPIKLKILNKIEHIELTLNELTKTKNIYQFYFTKPFFSLPNKNILHLQVQISKFSDINKII